MGLICRSLKLIKQKIKIYSELVMFEHTAFNLPFGYLALFLAAGGLPSYYNLFWVTVAMAGARNGANAWNRYADREIDARNDRTAGRHLPSGEVTTTEVLGLTAFFFSMLVLAALMLNPICIKLLPLAVLFMVFYSYTKRFTWACHFLLGMAVSLAPVGAWLAVRGSLSIGILVLALIQTLWVTGFDIIYATQDYEFDTRERLHSVPARFGVKRALQIAGGLHLLTVILLVSLHYFFRLGLIYDLGVVLVGLLLLYEHKLVGPDDLSQVKIASYSINQLIGPLLLIALVIDLVM